MQVVLARDIHVDRRRPAESRLGSDSAGDARDARFARIVVHLERAVGRESETALLRGKALEVQAVANAIRIRAIHPAQLAACAIDETRHVSGVGGDDALAHDARLAIAGVARAEREPIPAAQIPFRQIEIVLVETDGCLALGSVALGRR